MNWCSQVLLYVDSSTEMTIKWPASFTTFSQSSDKGISSMLDLLCTSYIGRGIIMQCIHAVIGQCTIRLKCCPIALISNSIHFSWILSSRWRLWPQALRTWLLAVFMSTTRIMRITRSQEPSLPSSPLNYKGFPALVVWTAKLPVSFSILVNCSLECCSCVRVICANCFSFWCSLGISLYITGEIQEEIDNLLENVPQVGQTFEILNKIGSGRIKAKRTYLY